MPNQSFKLWSLSAGLTAIAVTATARGGTLYSADSYSNVIDIISPTGTPSTFATGFNAPTNITFDPAGNLYVADSGSDSIKKVTPAGVTSSLAVLPTVPYSLVYSNGALYVSATATGATNGIVDRVSLAGAVSPFATGVGSANDGIAKDAAGNLYLTNGFSSNTISRITPTGTVSTFASSGLNDAAGIAISLAGNVYVANSNGDTVSEFDTGGNLLATLGSFQAGLREPVGLTLDSSGDVFVGNYSTSSIVEITPQGAIVPFASGGNIVTPNPAYFPSAVPEPASLGLAAATAAFALGRRRPKRGVGRR